jgi:CheY-like chemotaxis protein
VEAESGAVAWDDGRPLVLIIDEEKVGRDLYGHSFSSQGFQVMCAVGVTGLASALRRERPRLIVTELRARDLTLNQLIARLRCDETTRCIPVMVLTTCCDEPALTEAKAVGAAAVLPKLADFDVLKQRVIALCG